MRKRVRSHRIGPLTYRVAVVENLRATVLEADHGLDVAGHRLAGAFGERNRITFGCVLHIDELYAEWKVGERVVGRGLVGDDVDRYIAAQQLGDDLGGVTDETDRQGALRVSGCGGASDRVVEVGGAGVEVAVFDASFDPGGVAVDADRDAAVHGDRQWLRAAHPAESRGERDGASQAAVAVPMPTSEIPRRFARPTASLARPPASLRAIAPKVS